MFHPTNNVNGTHHPWNGCPTQGCFNAASGNGAGIFNGISLVFFVIIRGTVGVTTVVEKGITVRVGPKVGGSAEIRPMFSPFFPA